MIPEPIRLQFIKILAEALTTEEIDTLGRHIEPRFNAHIISGEPFGLTLRRETAARTAVNYFTQKGLLDKLIVLLLHSDSDPTIVGRSLAIPEMQTLLQKMGAAGFRYDPNTGAFVQVTNEEEKDTWGYLKEGELYHFAYLSIDIAENSRLQITYPKPEIEIVYQNLFQMIQKVLKRHQGKIWTWAGDGGLAAFYLEDKIQAAVQCSLEIFLNLIQFNLSTAKNRLGEPIVLRIAAHDGLTHYKENKGTILSEAINYVAHLEKKGTPPGHMAISQSIYNVLGNRMKGVFEPKGPFENIDHYTVNLTFDWLKKFL